MSEQGEDCRTQIMIAAVWRAVAKSCAATTTAGHAYLFPEECKQAVKVAEHVEKMLLIMKELYK